MKKLLIVIAIGLLVATWALAADININPSTGVGQVIESTALTSAGYTDRFVVRGLRPKEEAKSITAVGVSYTVTHIDTNVVVQVLGSHDGTNWFNVRASGNVSYAASDTVTSNGTYFFKFGDVAVTRYIKGRYVSEKGDSTATVAFRWLFGE